MSAEKLAASEVSKAEVLSIIDVEHLISVLIDANVPLDLWGKNGAKTVDHLFDEILNKKTELALNDSGEIERRIEASLVEVIYVSKGATVYGLKEDKQILNDGSVIKRELSTTLEERMTYGESPDSTALKILNEELDIDSYDEFMEFRSRTTIEPSRNYPGLITYYKTQPYMVSIDAKSFKPDGYIKTQPDKTSFYVWDIING